MNWHPRALPFATLTLLALMFNASPGHAQVAGGSTKVDISTSTSTQIAMGWSVKKTLLGKSIYNDADNKVGKIEDLIISPDKSVSFVIVGAGGFVGIGRHDVAIPVTQIQDRGGKLFLPTATKESIKAMPAFDYTSDTTKRDQFVAAADKDIAKARDKMAELDKKAGEAAADLKAKLAKQSAAIKTEVTAAEAKVAELKQATSVRWREYEAGVNAATARLRKAVDSAAS
jgi:sporulation protein YlmC with PRC-barrel domain